MNWLAHIFLSEHHIDFQMGNYLADSLKGRAWEGASYEVKQGLYVHKIIDSYTDSHEQFIQSKLRLSNKGLLRPIIIDITYDYFLTKNWEKFCHIPMKEFTDTFYKQANTQIPQLPLKVQKPLNRIIQYDVLNKYQSIEQLNIAFQKLDKRLSPRLFARDTASSYFEKVHNNIEELEEDFLVFFPQLCQKVKENLNQNNIKHWVS